jgi:hypothetical protein
MEAIGLQSFQSQVWIVTHMVMKKFTNLFTFIILFSLLQSCAEQEFNSIEQATNSRDDNGAKTGRWVEYINMNGTVEDIYQEGVSKRFRLLTYDQGCPIDAIKEYTFSDSSLFSSYSVKCKSPALLGRPLEEIRDTTYFYNSNQLTSIEYVGAKGTYIQQYHYKDFSASRYDSSTVIFISTEVQPRYSELYNSMPWDVIKDEIDQNTLELINAAVRTNSYRIIYHDGNIDTTEDLLQKSTLPELENLLVEAKKLERERKNNPLYQATTCDCCNKRIRYLKEAYTAKRGDWGIQKVSSGRYMDFQIKMMMAFRPLLGSTFFCSPRCSNQCS